MKNKTWSILSFLCFVCLVACFLSCSDTTSKPEQSAMKFGVEATNKVEASTVVIENGTLDTLQYYTIPVTRTAIYNYAYDSFYVVRHKYVKPTVPVEPPPVVVVPVSGYTTTYSNGYDTKADFSDDQLGKGSISNTIFKSGTGSFKSVVSVGDVAISSGFRSEQQYTGAAQNPLEGRTEYDVRYESFEKPGWGGSSIQWHPYGGGSAFLFLETAEGNFSVYQYIKGYGASLGKIVLGQWYHIAWEIKWSTGNDGYARLLIDGKLIWSYTGATWDAKLSTAPPYVKLGVNYFSNVPLTQGSQHGSVIYYDNFTVSKKN